MKNYFVRLSETEFLMFQGFIKDNDTFMTLIERFQKGEVQMHKCFKQNKEDYITKN